MHNSEYLRQGNGSYENKQKTNNKKEANKDLPNVFWIAMGFPSGELRIFLINLASCFNRPRHEE